MAIVVRGENGEPHRSDVFVYDPPIADREFLVDEDTVVKVEVACGEEVTIRLSRIEELQLLADLVKRIQMRLDPPSPPPPPPIKRMKDKGKVFRGSTQS